MFPKGIIFFSLNIFRIVEHNQTFLKQGIQWLLADNLDPHRWGWDNGAYKNHGEFKKIYLLTLFSPHITPKSK